MLALCGSPGPALASDGEPSGEVSPRVVTGDQAPPFSLPDQAGRSRSLEEITGDKSLVLIFFRGVW
jgi:hypothetical protein